MTQLPSPICFIDPEDRNRINQASINEQIECGNDFDLNVEDYKIIHTYSEYKNNDPIEFIVIQRISDGKMFQMGYHPESWECTFGGYITEYGEEVIEVKPVPSIKYVPVGEETYDSWAVENDDSWDSWEE